MSRSREEKIAYLRNRTQNLIRQSGKPYLVCQICGLVFRKLPVHLNDVHGITSREYAIKHLRLGEKVIAPDIIAHLSKLAIDKNSSRFITTPEVLARARMQSPARTAKLSESRKGRKLR